MNQKLVYKLAVYLIFAFGVSGCNLWNYQCIQDINCPPGWSCKQGECIQSQMSQDGGGRSDAGFTKDTTDNEHKDDQPERVLCSGTDQVGCVEVFAGQCGTKGSQLGHRLSSLFEKPGSVYIDGEDIYVVDLEANRVVRIDTDGNTHPTIGSGKRGFPRVPGPRPALEARLNQASKILKVGNDIYIVENLNQCLRRFRNGTLDVFVGNCERGGYKDAVGPEARFFEISGIAHSRGMIYITETNNHTIRSINLATREVKTIAGTTTPGHLDGPASTARFSKPSDIVVMGDRLVVTDTRNHAIRSINLSTFEVTTLVGKPGFPGFKDGAAKEALFIEPHALAVAGQELYIADWGNKAIRVLREDGVVSIVSGACPSRLNNQCITSSKVGSALEAQYESILSIAYQKIAGKEYLYVPDAGAACVLRLRIK